MGNKCATTCCCQSEPAGQDAFVEITALNVLDHTKDQLADTSVDKEFGKPDLQDDGQDEMKPDRNMKTAVAPAKMTDLKNLPKSREFSAKLTKGAADTWGVGLKKSALADQLVIAKAAGNALSKWNSENPRLALQQGDQIIAANGTAGLTAMLKTLAGSDVVELVLRRRLLLDVKVTKKGPLGMKINPNTLKIGTISDGIISEYNRSCAPTDLIIEGDCLVGVNGVTAAESNDLLGELAKSKEAEELNLVFTRAGFGQ